MYGEKPKPLGLAPTPQSFQPLQLTQPAASPMQAVMPMQAQQPKPIAQPSPKPAAMDDPNREISIDEFDDMVADQYQIPRNLFRAMTRQESQGDPNAVSPTGVRGRQQVTQKVAKMYNLNRDDPFEQSVAAGRYLREQFDALKDAPGFKDDDERWVGGLARYYGGPGAVDRDGVLSDKSIDGVSNPAEHVERVAKFWAELNGGGQTQAPSGAPAVPPAQKPIPLGKPLTTRGPVVGPQANPFSFTQPTGFQSAIQTPTLGQFLPTQTPAARPGARPTGKRGKGVADQRPTLESLPQSNDPRFKPAWEQDLIAREFVKSLQDQKAQAQVAEKLRIEEEAARVPKLYGMGESAMRFGRGLVTDSAKTLVQAPLMGNRDDLSKQVREDLARPIEEFGRQYFPIDERNPASMNPLTGGFWTAENLGKIATQNLPQAAGSMLPYMAVGRGAGIAARLAGGAEAAGAALGGASRLGSVASKIGIGTVDDLASAAATSGFGSAQGVVSGYEAAKAAGLSEDAARKSGLIEGFIGMLEGVGSPGSRGKFVKSALSNVRKEGREEFIQEAFSQLGQGINAAYLTGYDPNKGLGDVVGEAIGAGGLGGVLGGLAATPGAIAGRRAEKMAGRGATPEAGGTPPPPPLPPPVAANTSPVAPSPAAPPLQRPQPLGMVQPISAENPVRVLAPGEAQKLSQAELRSGVVQTFTIPQADGSAVEVSALVQRNMRPELAQLRVERALANAASAPATLEAPPTPAAAPGAMAQPATQADLATAELTPRDRKNRSLTAARQAANEASAAYSAALKAGDFNSAEGSLMEQRQYLRDLKSLIGKSQNSGDIRQKGMIEKELTQIGQSLGEVRKAKRQAEAPAPRAPRSGAPLQAPGAPSSPLLSEVSNPSGGVPTLKSAPIDFTRLAERQERGQDNPLAEKNVLARIRQFGGINTAGQYSGELQGALDKRYPGLVTRKAGVGIKPDKLREMLRDDGYEVGEDLDSLFKLIDRAVAGENVRPMDRQMSTGELTGGESYSDFLRRTEPEEAAGGEDDIDEFLRMSQPAPRQGPQAAPTNIRPVSSPLRAPSGSLEAPRKSGGLGVSGPLAARSGSLETRQPSAPLGRQSGPLSGRLAEPGRAPARTTAKMSAREQAMQELDPEDAALIERALRGSSERPGPGQGWSFSPYRDLIVNNKVAVDKLFSEPLNSPVGRKAIQRLRKFAATRSIDPVQVENLLNYVRNTQLDRARLERQGLDVDEVLENPPTSELREFYSKEDQAPPVTKRLQHERFGEVEVVGKAPSGKLIVRDAEGDEHTIKNPRTTGNQSASYIRSEPKTEARQEAKPAPKKSPIERLRDALAAEYDAYDYRSESERETRDREIRTTFEGMSNEEMDGVLDLIQEDLNRDVGKSFMTKAQRAINIGLSKIGNDVRAGRARKKQIESRASQRAKAAEAKEANEWAGSEFAEDAEDFKQEFGRYPRDLREMRRGRPITEKLAAEALGEQSAPSSKRKSLTEELSMPIADQMGKLSESAVAPNTARLKRPNALAGTIGGKKYAKGYRLDEAEGTDKAPILYMPYVVYDRVPFFGEGSAAVYLTEAELRNWQPEETLKLNKDLTEKEKADIVAQVRQGLAAAKAKGLDGVSIVADYGDPVFNQTFALHESFHAGQYAALKAAKHALYGTGKRGDGVTALHDKQWAKNNKTLQKAAKTDFGKKISGGDLDILAAELPAYVNGGQLYEFGGAISEGEAIDFMFEYLEHVYDHRGDQAFKALARHARLSERVEGYFNAIREERADAARIADGGRRPENRRLGPRIREIESPGAKRARDQEPLAASYRSQPEGEAGREALKPQFIQDAEARLRDAAAGRRAGSGAEQLFDMAVVAGYRIYRSGMDFGQWARAVIKEVGNEVRPHLRAAWETLIADTQGEVEAARERQAEYLEELQSKQAAKGVRAMELGGEANRLEKIRGILREEAKANQQAGRAIPENLRRDFQGVTRELQKARRGEARNQTLADDARAEQQPIRREQIRARGDEKTIEDIRSRRETAQAKGERADELQRRLDGLRVERDAIKADANRLTAAGQAIPQRLKNAARRLDAEMLETRKALARNRALVNQADGRQSSGGQVLGFGFGGLQAFGGKNRTIPNSADLFAWKARVAEMSNGEAAAYLLDKVDKAVADAEAAANAGNQPEWHRLSRQAEKFARRTVQPSMRGRFFETIGAAQTLAQLGTLGFFGRNILGAAIFGTQSAIADRLAAMMDRAYSAARGRERKIIGGPLNPVKGIWEDWENYKKGWKKALADKRAANAGGSNSTIDIPKASTRAGQAFNNLLWYINSLPDKANWTALYERAYKSITEADRRAGRTSLEDLERADARAKIEADINSFKDENTLSTFASGFKRLLNVVSSPITGTQNFGLGDIIFKYPKTPANLLKRSIEYSPLGLWSAARYASKAMQGDPNGRRDAIQALSKVITGSATGVGMGAALAALGVIVVPDDDDMTSEILESERGNRGYSFNLSALFRVMASPVSGSFEDAKKLTDGDLLVPIGWAAPWALQASVGAAMYKKASLKKAGIDTFHTLAKGLEVMGDESVFRSIGDYIDVGIRGAKKANAGDEKAAAVEAIAAKFIKDTPQSFSPGILRAVGRAIDPNTRDYRPEDRSNKLSSAALEGANRALAGAIPGLSLSYPERTSAMTGEARKTSIGDMGAFGRAVAIVAPVMPTRYRDDAFYSEIIRLNKINDPAAAKARGEKGERDLSLYVPALREKETEIKGYQEPTSQLRGRENAFALAISAKGKRLVASPMYRAASDEKKMEMIGALVGEETKRTEEAVKPALNKLKAAMPRQTPKSLQKPGPSMF